MAIGVLFTLSSATKKEGDYDWLKQRLAVTKAFTIEVLEAMPEDKYKFRPDDKVRTFQQQAYHVVYSILYYSKIFKGESNYLWVPGNESTKTKSELIAWAKEQFDIMEQVILNSENNPQLTAGIMSYLDHNAHHRGQMIIYLRMNDIPAPNYR